jgi:flavin reductase (DIM6/NTAB) family NADH-FMN oxidoreductase RutF
LKIDVEYLRYMWPMRHFLITCGDMQHESNIISISFCMPVSKEPPSIACAIGRNALSCSLIETCHEFVINVPPKKLKREIYYCGFHSGRDVDKFKETGLTARPAKKARAPIIEECVAHMECVVYRKIETGDKYLFIGEIVEAYADESVVNGNIASDFASGDFPEKIYSIR